MNDERLDRLINRHLNGDIDDLEVTELEERLLHSAADREHFWKLAEVHGLLHEQMQGLVQVGVDSHAELHLEQKKCFTERKEALLSTIFMRPIAALAAGVLIGLCGASAVWAMVGDRAPLAKMIPLPLVNGSFELSHPLGKTGVPQKAGIWSGDFAEIVENGDQVAPFEGRRMLRFLRGDNQLTPPDVKSAVAEIWQVVEIDPQNRKSHQHGQVVQVSAKFNATSKAASERVAFGISVLAFSGNATQAPELWRDRRELALATADKEELADAEPSSWQSLAAQVTVPAEANLLLVQLRVTRKGPKPFGQEFGSHFADDVILVERLNAQKEFE